MVTEFLPAGATDCDVRTAFVADRVVALLAGIWEQVVSIVDHRMHVGFGPERVLSRGAHADHPVLTPVYLTTAQTQ